MNPPKNIEKDIPPKKYPYLNILNSPPICRLSTVGVQVGGGGDFQWSLTSNAH